MAIEVADMTAVAAVVGTEKIPASDGGSPVSITPAQLLTYINDTVFPTGSFGRITSAGFQVKNITTGLYHTIYLEGASGAGTLKFQTGEE
jgi:hypothetical protein